MNFTQPAADLVRQRYSCRNYQHLMLSDAHRQALASFLKELPPGPFGSAGRFLLAAAGPDHPGELRGLGTYGFMRGMPSFIIGAARPGAYALEDFGYQLESAILYATGLGLGTCWLGGSFTRSSFARKIQAGSEEVLPAVTAVGNIAHNRKTMDQAMRHAIGSLSRHPWPSIFFDDRFGKPLSPESAGPVRTSLRNGAAGPVGVQ